MKEIFGAFLGLVAFGLIVIAVSFGGYYSYAYFAPKYEAVRRDTMIESRAYSEATLRELYNYKTQYEATQDPSAKATIAAAARHDFEIFPQDRLPADLAAWMQVVSQ